MDNANHQQSSTIDLAHQTPTEDQSARILELDVASPGGHSLQNTQKPLTNHEVYEMNQQQDQLVSSKQQQQTSAQPAKRQSLYLPVGHRFERQESIIVGTPGFREKYGKFSPEH